MSDDISDDEILDLGAGILAIHFHDTYERLAPEYGYKTREESAVPWKDVPEANRRLMEATVRVVLAETMARFDKDAATIDALRDSLAEAERALVAEREVSVQVDRAARDWQAKLAEAERALVAEREVSVQVDRAARDWQAKLAEAERERDEAERKESLWRTEWEQISETARLLSADRNEHAAQATAAESRLAATERERDEWRERAEMVMRQRDAADRRSNRTETRERQLRDAAIELMAWAEREFCDELTTPDRRRFAAAIRGSSLAAALSDNRPGPEA